MALSEESKLKRRREKTVNLQMTAISWFLEFTAGTIGMALRNMEWAFNVRDLNVALWLWAIDIGLNFIVIPSSYILSNGVIKGLIIAEGWCTAFKPSQKSASVQPAHNGDMPPPIPANPMPPPIPTISGNIDQRLSRNGLHNLGKELNNLSVVAERQLFPGIHTVNNSIERDQSTESGQDENDNSIELVVMNNPPQESSVRGAINKNFPKRFRTAWN